MGHLAVNRATVRLPRAPLPSATADTRYELCLLRSTYQERFRQVLRQWPPGPTRDAALAEVHDQCRAALQAAAGPPGLEEAQGAYYPWIWPGFHGPSRD